MCLYGIARGERRPPRCLSLSQSLLAGKRRRATAAAKGEREVPSGVRAVARRIATRNACACVSLLQPPVNSGCLCVSLCISVT